MSENEKRLVGFFKQFVNRTLLKFFKTSEDTMAEWNYFSSLISSQNINYDKINTYIEIMANQNHSYSPSKSQLRSLKPPTEDKKSNSNSGIYGKKQEPSNDYERPDFMLNKTVGGNADRIKFTGMFSKPNMYSFQSKQKKKYVKQASGGIGSLIQNMVNLCNNMTSNQSKLQSSKNGFLSSTSSNITPSSNDSNFSRWKPQQKYR